MNRTAHPINAYFFLMRVRIMAFKILTAGVHPHPITQWKQKALEIIPLTFNRTGDSQEQEQEESIDELYRQIA